MTFRLTRGGVAELARPQRADARRNVDALLEAATAVFAATGVDGPVKEIADRAGLGVGTLYRHFPRRSDLVIAVFRREVDACADAAAALSAAHPPGEALARWLQRYAEFLEIKPGLSSALHSGDPAFDELPTYFRQRFGPALESLLVAARHSGEIGAEVSATDLLYGVANLCLPVAGEDPGRSRRLVALLVEGLRHGAERSAAG